MVLIEIKQGSFKYDDSDDYVIRNIDISVQAGRILSIQGRNGTGKSTLLKAIAGLYRFTSGEVVYDKSAYPVYMDQFAGDMLSFELTIREQLEGFTKNRELAEIIYKSLQSFDLGLEKRLNDFTGHLSGGQRQIVALLSVIATGANIICLDEFISALDQKSIEAACHLIEHFREKYNLAVIVISHAQIPLKVNNIIVLELSGGI